MPVDIRSPPDLQRNHLKVFCSRRIDLRLTPICYIPEIVTEQAEFSAIFTVAPICVAPTSGSRLAQRSRQQHRRDSDQHPQYDLHHESPRPLRALDETRVYHAMSTCKTS
ncbi:hypothetical protein E2F46_06590 [Luteimonas aestuarii]|uniref:Uncharacterized protein n=1 Tax=Luteimonas aestuarii TaxID=453837 RepID=A0A4R5TYG3_9GAMM|nr:hypothetical protein [Luteimonas aestuarii]TDK26258.1 hypothetical protein E2F46_06590 [Luteimonas aestuarii]